MKARQTKAWEAVQADEPTAEMVGAARERAWSRLRWAAAGPRRVEAWPAAATVHGGRWWAAAAAVLVAGLAWGWGTPGATHIEAITGSVAEVSGGGVGLAAVGAVAGNGDLLQTGDGSDLVLRLPDGTEVEGGGATGLAVSRGWGGFRVRLERGRIIVAAAHQRWGRRMRIETGASEVVVKGTVFAVNRTGAGTRVTVAEGAVGFDTAAGRETVSGGQQGVSGAAVPRAPLAEDFAWSRKAAIYLALLGVGPQAAPMASPWRAPAMAALPATAAPGAGTVPVAIAHPQVPEQAPLVTAQEKKAEVPAVGPPPAAKPAAAAPEAPALAVYREAEAAVADVPEELQAWELAQIAIQEEIHNKDEAAQVWIRAFHNAAGLAPASSADDMLGKYRARNQQFVEEEAIINLTGLGQQYWETAHALARTGASPRGDLYTPLITAAANGYTRSASERWLPTAPPYKPATAPGGGRGGARGGSAPDLITAPYDVLALARECYDADGSFPYYAATTAVQSYVMDAGEKIALLHLGLQAAATEATGRSIENSQGLLNSVHKAAPQLDDELMAVLSTDVGKLDEVLAGQRPGYGGPLDAVGSSELRLVGNHFIQIVSTIDANRGQDLRSRYPNFTSPTGLPSFNLNTEAKARQEANNSADATLAAATGLVQNTPPERMAKYLSLVTAANTLAEQHPAQAREAAAEAMTLTTDDTVKANLEVTGRMAMNLETYLHEPTTAAEVMTHCLDISDQAITAFQEALRNAAPEERPKLYQDMIGFPLNDATVEIYGFAAKVNFAFAHQRAGASNAAVLKPLLVLRTALGLEP